MAVDDSSTEAAAARTGGERKGREKGRGSVRGSAGITNSSAIAFQSDHLLSSITAAAAIELKERGEAQKGIEDRILSCPKIVRTTIADPDRTPCKRAYSKYFKCSECSKYFECSTKQ